MPLRALFTLLLTLIVCSAVPVERCKVQRDQCACCEKVADKPVCCAASQQTEMDKSAPAGVDLKLAVTPSLMVILPVAAVEAPSRCLRQLTPFSSASRFERLGIRLI
ncbi:MAG: hypothetical protein JWL90_2871 [Chthoniobacteraceae bacterium]|nr:hypothetical protein [Chthoniobacteraceae bacterium]